jgi:drug/metabolite transporter (DMT)-like permease
MKQDVSPNTSRPLDAIAIVIVIAMCLSWGFNQVAIKIALHEIPPFIQSAARSAIATVLVAAWAHARGLKLFERDGSLVAGLVAGALFGFEFLLIYPGLAWTTASRAVLFIYLAPFFVVIGSRWFLPGDHFHLSQWAGLALSFLGIVIAFGVPTPAADPRQMLGDLMMVGAAATWAATTIVIKASVLSKVSFEKTTLYQLVVSAPMLAIAALVAGERMTGLPSAIALGAFAYQTVWVVSITFVVWFALIVRYSASRLSAFTFLTPLFGVAAGHFVLGEPLTPAFLLAAALVAAGLVLVNRPR